MSALVSQSKIVRLKTARFVQTTLVLVSLCLLPGSLAYLVYGPFGLLAGASVIVFIFLTGLSLPASVLLKVYRAVPVDIEAAPGLKHAADLLSAKAGINAPLHLYIFPSTQLNALSAGTRRRPGLALSTAVVSALQPAEVSAIMAHELAHIRHGDLRYKLAVRILYRATAFMAWVVVVMVLMFLSMIVLGLFRLPLWFFTVAVLAPFLIQLLSLNLSRQLEFAADLEAVRLTGDLDLYVRTLIKTSLTEAQDPLARFKRRLPGWFRTHPDLADRVRELKKTFG